MTGYTKDYVGQLCREGKIIAQLVGRNWYILETSIHKHRFELENQSLLQHQTVSKTTHRQDNMRHHLINNSINYIHDNADIIQLQKKEPHDPDPDQLKDIQHTEEYAEPSPKGKADALSTMQNVWQEWFTTAMPESQKGDNKEGEITKKIENDDQDCTVQPISVHRMEYGNYIEQTDNSIFPKDTKNISSNHTSANSIGSRFIHIMNIILMLIALLFFIITMLNIFLSPNNTFKQLQYISGVSVYTVK